MTSAVAPPSILTAATDEYIARVLAKIPTERRGVLGVDVSNAGVVGSVGVRLRTDLTAVGFAGKTRAAGLTYGGRVQFVF